MKLLVFAHTPPPHHGQSYMVKLMLEGFGGDRRTNPELQTSNAEIAFPIECYHVNCRYSDSVEDIGSFRLHKMWLVLRYCLEAIWCRFRYGVRAFYYVPAPGKRAALYRDWIVMLLCRPFFPKVILHWHAAGLGDWLKKEASWLERWITHRLLGRPELGIALTIPGMRDALWFRSRRVVVIPNGIPDPCPNYATVILPVRHARQEARAKLRQGEPLTEEERQEGESDPAVLQILFLGLCTRDKGLFDALEAVALANRQLREAQAHWSMRLTVAGKFLRGDEETAFRERIEAPDLRGAVHYAGQVMDSAKTELLRLSDTLCFPTFYAAESFGLVLVEAMAAGMNVVTTRWRANGDVMPPEYPFLVPVGAPEKLAANLIATFDRDATGLRDYARAHYDETAFLRAMADALRAN